MPNDKSFKGIKIYYSGSIRGEPEADPEFPRKLVNFMTDNGANVLSEHVVYPLGDEMDKIMVKKAGIKLDKLRNHPQRWFLIRDIDTGWVDEADCMIAIVNGPSHGVGMEIERALLKPERGLSKTPVLCLIHQDFKEGLSYMIRGIKNADFYLKTYQDLSTAVEIIDDFLLNKV
jgi:hypothetical protein